MLDNHCLPLYSKSVLQLRICGLEHCYVTNGHAGDRFLDVLFSFLFAFFFRTTLLQKLPNTPLPFRTAICTSCPEFLKKMAYNAFFAISVHLAILGLLSVPCYQFSAWAHKNGPMSHHQ